jgi:hypothetical protein
VKTEAVEIGWWPGRAKNVPAELVADLVRELEQEHGVCDPALLVDAARPESSPLHGLFLWDDAVAAERHRLLQAKGIIRSVRVTFHELAKTGPAFLNVVRVVPGEGEKRGYVRTEVALANKTMRDRVVQDALTQLKAWQKRYRMISELAKVIEAIDGAIDK